MAKIKKDISGENYKNFIKNIKKNKAIYIKSNKNTHEFFIAGY